MTLSVRTQVGDPYGDAIRQFVIRTFPQITTKQPEELIDALTEAIVATGSVRFGPRPGPEDLVAIRDIIRDVVSRNGTIPFQVPWGSEKPDGSSIDLAEVAALKTMAATNERIEKLYAPGAEFVVHLEDASAPFLFHWKAEQAAAEAAQYVGDFTKLVRLLQIPRIVLRPESSQTTIGQFTYQAAAILDAVEGMIRGPGDLSGLPKTWVQPTPHAIENILQRQEKLYPEMTLDQHIDMTARYFASAWARRALNLRNPTGRIGFSFTEPNGQGGARIHMRTLPSSMTQNHIAPWRAKGYFKMSEADGLAKPKLASWRDPLPLNKCSMTLTDGTVSVQVQTDYVVPT